jgi:AraC-type DNA-binding domain-containing proteins
VQGLLKFLENGLRCNYIYEIKIREFLFILKVCYSEGELRDFFSDILSIDMKFVSLVLGKYRDYSTVKELAYELNYSIKVFSKKFKDVFGMTVYQWMKEKKSREIIQDIVFSNKAFKQIAYEHNFNSQQHLNNYCRSVFGNCPKVLRNTNNKKKCF